MSKFKNLKRLVTVTNSSIFLSTQSVLDVDYAFYLETPSSIMKSFYDESSFREFNIDFEFNKLYTAYFYYKYNGITERYLEFFVIDKVTHEPFMVNKKSLAEKEGYLIDYYNMNSEITFIVFNGVGSTKTTKPFGLNFLIGLGFNVIACCQNDDQYQSLSFEEFKNIVSEYVKDKKVFLYGSSLGGYSAIYYAGAVDGTVIAAAPRNSAHPKFESRSEKFEKLNFIHKDIIENSKTVNPVHVIMDTLYKPDVIFLNNFIKPAYPDLKVYSFEYAGHEVLFHVNKTKQLKKIILDIVNDRDVIIDQSISSIYTDIGKAQSYLNKKMKKECLEFLNKAKQSSDIDKRCEAKIKNIMLKLSTI